jgi:hypothetical protein
MTFVALIGTNIEKLVEPRQEGAEAETDAQSPEC